MEENIVLCLFSSAAFAMHFVHVHRLQCQRISTSFILSLTHLSSGICMLVFILCQKTIWQISNQDLSFIFGASFITLLAKYLQYKSYQTIDLTYVSSFSALTPVFGLMLGVLLFNDSLTLVQVLSVFFIFVSAFLIHIPEKSRSDILMPIKLIGKSIPYRMAFLSSVLPVFSLLLSKKALFKTDTIVFSFLCTVIIGFASTTLAFSQRTESFNSLSGRTKKDLFFATLYLCFAQVGNAYLIKNLELSVFSSVSRVTILFQTIFSYYFLKQVDNLRWKLFFSSLIFISFLGLFL